MTEMEEHVANAIHIARDKWIEEHWPAEWTDVPDDVLARSAIEATREPTRDMLKYGANWCASVAQAKRIWTAMHSVMIGEPQEKLTYIEKAIEKELDAALAEPKESEE